MTRKPTDPEISALEAELREDRLPDPGDAFFAELEERVMQRVAKRPAPRRSPWSGLGELWRWLWRPAPVAALVGAAAAVLVAVLLLLDHTPASQSSNKRVVGKTVPDAGGVAQKRPATGKQWLAQLPPAGTLSDLDESSLPALFGLLSEADDLVGPEDDDDLGGEPVTEQSLEGLTEAQLRALGKELEGKPVKRPRRRPAPSMRRSG